MEKQTENIEAIVEAIIKRLNEIAMRGLETDKHEADTNDHLDS